MKYLKNLFFLFATTREKIFNNSDMKSILKSDYIIWKININVFLSRTHRSAYEYLLFPRRFLMKKRTQNPTQP